MNALSKLLVKVSKRVLTRNPTNDELLQVADRVVLWSNANYITEQQVDEIAAAMPEEPVAVEGAGAETSAEAAEIAAEAAEGESTESENASRDFSGMTKAELLEYCAEHGIEAYESWTKAEIIAAIEAA